MDYSHFTWYFEKVIIEHIKQSAIILYTKFARISNMFLGV